MSSHPGQYSIRINDQFRVCFRWQDGDAHEVEIVDFGTTPDFWMNLQTHYDLEVTSWKEAARIEKEVSRRVVSG